jgi:opacity protein-like surface antigen
MLYSRFIDKRRGPESRAHFRFDPADAGTRHRFASQVARTYDRGIYAMARPGFGTQGMIYSRRGLRRIVEQLGAIRAPADFMLFHDCHIRGLRVLEIKTDPGIPCSFFFENGGPIPPRCESQVPTTTEVSTADGSYDVQGGLIGGTLGYNWQQGPWVFGIEGDYSWADISGSSNTCGAGSGLPHSCGTKLESLGTARGRIGYATGATGTWLPYVTGGLAFGELNAWDNLIGVSGSDFRTGWTLGGGIETAFAPNWTFKVEYLYVDFGSQQMFNVAPGVPETVSFTANVIRAGINYEFH